MKFIRLGFALWGIIHFYTAHAVEFLNQSYGPHYRQTFDLWLPENTKKAPLVIFIHPGGWYQGSKEELKEYPKLIKSYLDRQVAVAAINYRFLPMAPLQDIMREDIAGFVQFIRYHAKDYQIDKKRILCFGVSAGGSACLWLGTTTDLADSKNKSLVKRESTRLLALGHINAQISYDFLDWHLHFKTTKVSTLVGEQMWARYYLKSLKELISPRGIRIRKFLDMYENLSSDDPPMLLYNSYPPGESKTADHLFHSPRHAELLHQKALRLGVKSLLLLDGEEPFKRNSFLEVKFFFLNQIKQSKNIFSKEVLK